MVFVFFVFIFLLQKRLCIFVGFFLTSHSSDQEKYTKNQGRISDEYTQSRTAIIIKFFATTTTLVSAIHISMHTSTSYSPIFFHFQKETLLNPNLTGIVIVECCFFSSRELLFLLDFTSFLSMEPSNSSVL